MGGGDKCLLDLGGRPMLARIIDRLAPQCGPLALNANGDPARFAGFGLTVLPDSMADFPGPLAGILAGMDWAASLGADRVLSVAGDTPFFPPNLAERLTGAGEGIVLAASRADGGQVQDHPTFGLWPTALRDDLRAFLNRGERRVRGFARDHGAAIAAWDTAPVDPFFNINTPEDLDRARQASVLQT
jgi:molybdopterin-guanine dinucleotide biosynthesis protein A